MKKISTLFVSTIFTVILSAQDVRLNDSVIFINNKPIAFYAKELSNSTLRYNIEVYNANDYILIKAEVIKFNAPVPELKPFYYYELSFPPMADTFAIYIEDEAFPLVLAKIIRDYNLISNDQLNKKGVDRFIRSYEGGPALLAKIRSVEDYLNETRNLHEQVVRDRTKPVTIINDRIIMQDGIKIGTIRKTGEDPPIGKTAGTNQPPALTGQSEYNKAVANIYRIFLETERQASLYGQNYTGDLRKGDLGYELYQLSRPKKNNGYGSVEDLILQRICLLIADYSL
ncbi:MAG: hypothetical protein WBP16_11390 [Ferruginibacter sp.]